MNKKTKMILTAVGVAAVVVPALLLVFASARTASIPEVATSKRQIDTDVLERKVNKPSPTPNIAVLSSPSPLPSPGVTITEPPAGSASAR